jgi:hypothetical protein
VAAVDVKQSEADVLRPLARKLSLGEMHIVLRIDFQRISSA